MTTTPHPGPTIRALREASGLTQTALATAIGIPPNRLCNLEARRLRGRATLPRIAAELGVAVEVITGHVPPIRDLRLKWGLSLDELATIAKVTVPELVEFEIGAELPDLPVAERLGRRLGIPAEVLARVPTPTAAAA